MLMFGPIWRCGACNGPRYPGLSLGHLADIARRVVLPTSRLCDLHCIFEALGDFLGK